MNHPDKLRKPLLRQLRVSKVRGDIVPFQPIWVRICHWGFAFTLTVVLISGLQLHKPAYFFTFNFSKVLTVHLIFAWFAMGFLGMRLADALLRRDDSLLPGVQDLKQFPQLMAYYFFRRSQPPPHKKYNSGQRLVYSSWIILFLAAVLLGLTSYWQGSHLLWVWKGTGGFQVIRWLKFTIAIYFLATIPVHIYLSLTEDISRLQSMITGYERKPPPENNP